MSAAHNPREDFVNQLELQLRSCLRRRDLTAGSSGWLMRSKTSAALAIAAVALVSMAVGGGVVATAYEAQFNEQRDLLLRTFDARAVIAKQRLALATEQLHDLQQRFSIGTESHESVADAQVKVTEAEAELKSIELDMAEIRATGREPVHMVSAAPVAGRDFVTERWRVEMAVPSAALAREKARAQAVQSRFDVGLANSMDVESARTRVIELEMATEAFERKLVMRQAFLKGAVPAAVAELRVLEAETELRRKALVRRADLARRQLQDVKERTDVGTADPLHLAEAQLRLQELQLEMSKADYELLLIRKQLGK